MPAGELFILSAPSGTGKTTLIRRMMESVFAGDDGLVFAVSHTTRKAREGEVDGRDYHFVDAATFDRMVAEDRFLEWAKVHGNLYGTSFEEVLPRLERGIDVLVDIDVQGAAQAFRRHPEAHTIFIMPPSPGVLKRRLRGRGLDDGEAIRTRLSVTVSEIKRYDQYQYVIINDDLERASQALGAIILEKRHRMARVGARARDVLKDFDASFDPS